MAHSIEQLDSELAALNAEVEALRQLLAAETACAPAAGRSRTENPGWFLAPALLEETGEEVEQEWYACG